MIKENKCFEKNQHTPSYGAALKKYLMDNQKQKIRKEINKK